MTRRSQEDWLDLVLTSLDRDMREERWSDLVLYSSEGIPVAAHKAVLSQSPHLRPLLTSLSCCQGGCAHQEPLSLLLPEVSYRLLLPAVTFLYTGLVQISRQDRGALGVSFSPDKHCIVLTDLSQKVTTQPNLTVELPLELH